MKTDEQLVESGDLAALVDRYRESLTSYFASQVRDPGAADDLAQAVFLQLGTFPAGLLFRPWLYTVADKLARQHRRRIRRERKKFGEYAATAEPLV